MKKQIGFTHMYILDIQSRNALALNHRQRSEPNLLITAQPDHYLTKSKNCYR